jgi:alpha-tubulin suppressor-like RCC1 family protein
MAITQVTSNVIEDDTIKPNKLASGGPLWDSSGGLSAAAYSGDGTRLTGLQTDLPISTIVSTLTGNKIFGAVNAKGFIGDGSKLIGVTPTLAVTEITANRFIVTPEYNNTIVLLNSLSTINIDIDPSNLDFASGHKTYFIQTNTGRGKLISPEVYSLDNLFETKKQYSVCELEYLGINRGWTLYGNLTSIPLTAAVIGTAPVSGARFTSLLAGDYSSFLILSGTDVYAAGYNFNGQLGLNDRIDRSAFTKVSATWIGTVNPSAATGWSGFAFITNQKDLYVTSYLAGWTDGTSNNASTFTKVNIPSNSKWDIVATGQNYIFALSGTDLYSTGYNGSGQLGHNDVNYRSTFTKITIAQLSDGSTILNPKWTDIAGGGSGWTVYALSGTDAYAAGSNASGQMGDGTINTHRSVFRKIPQSWNKIAVNQYSVYALSGTDLYGCGLNGQGQLGLGDLTDRVTFTKVISALNGSTLIANPKWTDVATLSPGTVYALSGTDLYGSGANFGGQLGQNDTIFRSVFTKISGSWNSVKPAYYGTLDLSGTRLFGCGYNFYGLLGLRDTQPRLTFTQITGVAV